MSYDTFEVALYRLKAGQRVARAGWNGKGQFLEMQRPDAHSKMTSPYVYITTVDGGRVPWVASQSDLLAEDWQLVTADSGTRAVHNAATSAFIKVRSAIRQGLEGHRGVSRLPGLADSIAGHATMLALDALGIPSTQPYPAGGLVNVPSDDGNGTVPILFGTGCTYRVPEMPSTDPGLLERLNAYHNAATPTDRDAQRGVNAAAPGVRTYGGHRLPGAGQHDASTA